jgi:hypothetical protein
MDLDKAALEYTSFIINLKRTSIKITLKKFVIRNGTCNEFDITVCIPNVNTESHKANCSTANFTMRKTSFISE